MNLHRATPAQKALIFRLLTQLELDTPVVSIVHRPVFEEARVWMAIDIGVALDTVIGELSCSSASRLIDALERAVENDQ